MFIFAGSENLPIVWHQVQRTCAKWGNSCYEREPVPKSRTVYSIGFHYLMIKSAKTPIAAAAIVKESNPKI